MGLLYPFPVSLEETDFALKTEKKLTLKTYGLPYIFWFYALCVISVILFMFLAIKAPALKLIELGDDTDQLLGKALLSFIGILPIFILGFLFYEKRIEISENTLKISHRVFGIKLMSKVMKLEHEDKFTVIHFLSSPNLARIKADPSELGFQNKGYFVLNLIKKTGDSHQIDRHSRKSDLEKLKELLESVIDPRT